MEIEQKIEPSKLIIDVKEKILNDNCKDPTVFNINQPLRPELVYVRQQLPLISENFMRFLIHGIQENALIIGSRGSGKTALVKYVLQELKKMPEFDFEIIYVNCKGIYNSYRVMKEIIGEKKKISKADVYEYFKDYIKNLNKKCFLILDEVDLLSDDDLLYHLTRNEDFKNVHIIMISKTIAFWQNLTEDVKSSLNKQEIFFDTYGYLEIKNILTKRAESGLKEYDKTILFHIATANVSRAFSDVRAGLKVMQRVFRNNDFKKCSNYKDIDESLVKNINDYMDEEYSRLKEGSIRNLSDEKLLALYFVIKYGKSNSAYKKYTENAYVVMSKPHFLRMVNELAQMDLFTVQKNRNQRSFVLEFIENIGKSNKALVAQLINSKKILKGDASI